MKKIIISILCLGMALSAYSQRTPSAESSSSQDAVSSNSENMAAPQPYHKVMFTYSPFYLRMVSEDPNGESTRSGYHTIGLTYMHGSPLGNFPLYLEYGGGLQYMSYHKNTTTEKDTSSVNAQMVSVNVPVNLLYRFAFKGGKIHLAPYTGLYAKYNAWCKFSSDKKLSEKEDVWGEIRHFQLGWQIGAQFDISKFYLHVAYLTDITSLSLSSSDTKAYFGGFNVGVGVVF